jgi:hypothetical protein
VRDRSLRAPSTAYHRSLRANWSIALVGLALAMAAVGCSNDSPRTPTSAPSPAKTSLAATPPPSRPTATAPTSLPPVDLTPLPSPDIPQDSGVEQMHSIVSEAIDTIETRYGSGPSAGSVCSSASPRQLTPACEASARALNDVAHAARGWGQQHGRPANLMTAAETTIAAAEQYHQLRCSASPKDSATRKKCREAAATLSESAPALRDGAINAMRGQ